MHSWHTFHGWFYVDVFATKIRNATLVTASSRHILQHFGYGFFVTIRVKWYTRSLTPPLTKDAWNTAEKDIGKVAMQSPCEISEWVELGLHTIDPELDVLLSFVTILILAYCRLRPCDTSDMFLPNKWSTKTTACLWEGCSLYKHQDAKTVQLCSAGSVFGSSDFLSQTGNGPKDPRVEWRPNCQLKPHSLQDKCVATVLDFGYHKMGLLLKWFYRFSQCSKMSISQYLFYSILTGIQT